MKRAFNLIALSLLGFVLLLPLTSQSAFSAGFGKDKAHIEQSAGAPWTVSPGFHGGLNKLLEGYHGYGDDLGTFGIDLYIFPGRSSRYPSEWFHNFFWRAAANYSPLQVPEGNSGLKENVYSFNLSLLYQFRRLQKFKDSQWAPFVGLGLGAYINETELDTPASGKINERDSDFGWEGSIGLFTPRFKIWKYMRFVPEVRYHKVNAIGGKRTNIMYLLGWQIFFAKRPIL